MSIVIVGGSLAGLRAAENLRSNGWHGHIVILSAETTMPYNRPPLSKEFLRGTVDADSLAFALSPHIEDVEWRLGVTVVSSNLSAKTVTLDTGDVIAFEGLVAATGVSSRRLPIPGPAAGREVLRSIEDSVRLKERLQKGGRIVILGAGFIGCEVAATAREMGCDVDVVALDANALFIPLGSVVGSEIQRRHELTGVRYHMGRTISHLEGDDRVTAAVLDDGTRIETDFVLETVGSVANTGWLADNGLDLANGVLCDSALRIGGLPGIVAVGDVARFVNPLFDSPPLRIEHWQTAIDSARYAARTLLKDLGSLEGDHPDFWLMPWFWSDQGEIRLTSYGMLGLADRISIVEGELAGECAIGYYRGDDPVGIVLIGMKNRAARYKKWLMDARKAVSGPALVS